jgi:hypothetical protein
LNNDGFGVSNVRMVIRNGSGNVVATAITGTFGYYRFEGIAAGALYNIDASHKRYSYATRAVQVDGELTNVDFTPQP